MKKILRKGLFFLFLGVFVVSSTLMVRQLLSDRAGASAYADAQALASGTRNKNTSLPSQTVPAETEPEETVPEPRIEWVPEQVTDDPIVQEMAAIDLEALRLKNPDVIGWIRIPDTKINYPLMQGQDNDYYLHHTWDHQSNAMGSIFLECENSPDLTDFNTIVYGHNMNSGAMFAQLHKYGEGEFWKYHPYVYILCDAGVLRYEVFSAYRAEVDSVVYGLSFRQPETRAKLVLHALENSRIDTGIIPEENDRVLTLSTCSGVGYDNRWVVHARLKMVRK